MKSYSCILLMFAKIFLSHNVYTGQTCLSVTITSLQTRIMTSHQTRCPKLMYFCSFLVQCFCFLNIFPLGICMIIYAVIKFGETAHSAVLFWKRSVHLAEHHFQLKAWKAFKKLKAAEHELVDIIKIDLSLKKRKKNMLAANNGFF